MPNKFVETVILIVDPVHILPVPVTFDLFGTLVTVDRPVDPAAAVADELLARDVSVPDDWTTAYHESHIDAPEGAEVPLPAHVARALASRHVDVHGNAARRAVVAAFDPQVRVVEGAPQAVEAASEVGPIGILTNCSVPELVRRTLVRANLRDAVDCIVTSLACGWRKPDARAFEVLASRLECPPSDLIFVGDEPTVDGGVEAVGGTFVNVADVPPADLPEWIKAGI